MKILDFYADWCAPCRQLSVTLDKIKEEYPDIEIEKIDVEQHDEDCEDYGILSIPTLIFIKNGSIKLKKVGNIQYQELKKIIETI